MKVLSAFRVYESDVDLSISEQPVDSLRSLVLAYGVPVAFHNRVPKLFYLSERLEGVPDESAAAVVQIHGPSDQVAVLPQLMLRHRAGGLDIMVAFAISLHKYAVALRQHGARVAM